MSVVQSNLFPVATALGDRPSVWVVSRLYGSVSDVWMRRQVELMVRVAPRVVCWAISGDAPESERGRAVVIDAAADAEGDRKGIIKWLGRLRNAPGRNFCAPMAAERKAIARRMEQLQPGVILCHFGHTALRILPAAESFGIPVVVHFHGMDLSSSLRNRWYRWSLWPNLGRFAEAVVVGSHQRRLLTDRGMPASRVHLIPCGVPTGDFTAGQDHDGTPGRTIGFVAVSRLVAWKGPEYSLRAFGEVRRRGVRARLDLVGDGPMRGELERLARELSLGEAVVFHGAVAPEKVLGLLRDSDVFVQHSVDAEGCAEGFGVSIAEASACELPVVVTSCGGIEDQVIHGETGLVVRQRDVAGMAEAMEALARDPALRRRMGRAGRARMVEHFDCSAQVRRLEDVLLAAIKS